MDNKNNIWDYLNNYHFSWIFGLAMIFVSIVLVPFSEFSYAEYFTFLTKKAVVMLLGFISVYLWNTKHHNNDENIKNEPLAQSIYLGCILIAIALA